MTFAMRSTHLNFTAARAVAIALALLLTACRPDTNTAPAAASSMQAARLTGVGNASLVITTRVASAQEFFNQGLRLAQAFDHREAQRAFAEAARLDPDCAMCAWGMAYAVGPNINHPLRPADPSAATYVQRAAALASKAAPKERALISALAARHDVALSLPPRSVSPQAAPSCGPRSAPQGAEPLDIAYAQAMAQVARDFPDDDEIAVLYAEALLMLAPWEWWNRAGDVASEGTLAAIDTLERVLARSPQHAGANHFLIHALEGSRTPQRALTAAQRLGALAPDAGHMVHMPSHIFVRVGRYADATRVNLDAIEADRRLEAQLLAQGLTPLAHVSHHHHFLWASASMQGAAEVAIDAARWLAREANHDHQPFGSNGSNDYFLGLQWLALVRFSRWNEILAQPEPSWPAHASAYPGAVWRYARGVALARSGKLDAANRELTLLQSAAADPGLDGLTVNGIDDLSALLALAGEALRGEIALAQRRYGEALVHLRRAVTLEDALEAEEPPPWAVPTRQSLGAALLLAGRAVEAEAVFRADLARHPGNGWSLYGLAESLQRQKRSAAASAARKQFDDAWQTATLARPDSRF